MDNEDYQSLGWPIAQQSIFMSDCLHISLMDYVNHNAKRNYSRYFR